MSGSRRTKPLLSRINNSIMSRKTAREHSFRILFSFQFKQTGAPTLEERIEQYYADFGTESDPVEGEAPLTLPDEKDKAFILREVRDTRQHVAKINKRIEAALKDWKLNRLSSTDLTILQLAVYEMMYEPDIPVPVSVNEAIELAKKYSTDQSPAFINGVLGTISRELEGENL